MGRFKLDRESYASEARYRQRLNRLRKTERESTLDLVPDEVVSAFARHRYFMYYSGGFATFRCHERSRERFVFKLVHGKEYPWEAEHEWEVNFQALHFLPTFGNAWKTETTYCDLSDLESRLDVPF